MLPVNIDSLIKRKIVEYAAYFEPLIALGFGLFIYYGSILKCFSHFLLCASIKATIHPLNEFRGFLAKMSNRYW